MRRETGRGKDHFKIRDLLANEPCNRPTLDFLRTSGVGRRGMPGGRRKGEAQNEDSEREDGEERDEVDV